MANWRRDSSTTSLTGMLITLGRMRGRHGQQRLRDLLRRERHVLCLWMVEERVFERHQQHELEDENENDVAAEGRPACPLEQARA